LKRALARENCFVMTAPSLEWLRAAAPSQRQDWINCEGRLSGWLVDEVGDPYPEYITRFEQYVEALARACERERDTIAALITQDSSQGAAAFKTLVNGGANAVWIAEDCLHLRRHRSDTGFDSNPRRRDFVLSEARKLSSRLAELSPRFQTLGTEAGRIGAGGIQDAPVVIAVLDRTRQELNSLARRLTTRGPSADHEDYLALAQHLRETTGSFHDLHVCALLNGVRHKGNGKAWSPNALQQLRFRDKKGRNRLGEDVWTDILDDQVKKRRSLKNA
jgi:hypothetical protein